MKEYELKKPIDLYKMHELGYEFTVNNSDFLMVKKTKNGNIFIKYDYTVLTSKKHLLDELIDNELVEEIQCKNKITGNSLKILIDIIKDEDNDYVRGCIKFAKENGYLTRRHSDVLHGIMISSEQYGLIELSDLENKFTRTRSVSSPDKMLH